MTCLKNSLFFFILLDLLCIYCSSDVIYVKLSYHKNQYEIKDNSKLHIFCKEATEKSLITVWSKAYIKFTNVSLVDQIQIGESVEEVMKQLNQWFHVDFVQYLFQRSIINIPLYSNYCIGIKSKTPGSFYYFFDTVDYSNLLLLFFGLITFYSARFLSKQLYIYYISSVSIGVLGSILLLAFLLSKFLPKKTSIILLMISSTINTYILSNIKSLLFTYKYGFYFLIYVLFAAMISFSFAYYKGPVKNTRIYDLFRWSIQFLSVCIILWSSEYIEITCVIVACILLHQIFPIKYFKSLKRKMYKPMIQQKLLTEEEYRTQAIKETCKALEELKRYCNSPECNKWEIIKKLRNPRRHDEKKRWVNLFTDFNFSIRFAEFISGEDHVDDNEMTLYDLDVNRMTDDENF